MSRSSHPKIVAGTCVADRYLLTRRLGRGGFGDVWQARDTHSGSFVALKLLSQYKDGHQNPIFFWVELSILRSHRVPGIVQLLDEGLWNGIPFLVMEQVPGTPYPGKNSTPSGIVATTASLLDILGRVHAEGILHQDIKPENVLVNDRGEPTVLDFGIASDVNMDLSGDPRKLYGVYEYIAPERLLGEPATLKSDLYSVGVLLFRALAGTFPFQHSNTIELLQACANLPAPSLRDLAPNVPEHVVRLVDMLLSKDPAHRPSSATDAADMLRGHSKNRLSIEEWLCSHGISLSGPSVDQASLAALFDGTERLFHIPSRAASLLFRRTLGEPRRIVDEIRRWLEQGARFEGKRLVIGKKLMFSLDPEEPRPDSRDSKKTQKTSGLRRIEQREALARAWIEKGPLDRAVAELHDGLSELRSLHSHRRVNQDPEWIALQERLLLTWTDIALSDRTKQIVGPLQYELHRALRTPLIENLSTLVEASMAIPAGSDKAQNILNQLGNFDDIRIELRKQGLRAVACRRCSPEVEEETFREIDAWATQRKQNDILKARHAFWQGWREYRKGSFARAAEWHRLSSQLDAWPIDRISARIAAVSSLIETLCNPAESISLARSVLEEVRLCESPYLEARAEWVLRTALYRSGAALEPDLELVSAVKRLVGAPDLEAQICFCEAVFAYRAHDSKHCHALASEAARTWLHLKGADNKKSADNYRMAQALSWASPGSKPAMSEIKLAMNETLSCKTSGIGIQTLALLCHASTKRAALNNEDIERLALTVPKKDWDRRLDILSVNEALRMIGRQISS